MKTYLFETTATMKPYNNKKWWIDSGFIRPVTITAETLTEALKHYQTILKNDYCVTISDNAIKNKDDVFIDTKNGETVQTGYVITGSTDFNDEINYKWVTQYIDLWVTINIITNPFQEV